MGAPGRARLGSIVRVRRPEGSPSMPVLAVPGTSRHRRRRRSPSRCPTAGTPCPPGPDLLRVRGTGAAGEPVEVSVRSHTGPVGYAATDLVDALAGDATRPGTEVEPSFVVEIGGREWVARNISWDEATGPVVEVHLAAAVDGRGGGRAADVSRLVVATGRVRGATLDADYDVLQSVLETLVVGGTG